MKIYWSPLAVNRLEEIFEYISKDDISAAEKLTAKIFEKIESLATNPERGRKVPETDKADIREIFVGNFIIIYRIEPGKIFILTIRSFRQLLPENDFR